MNRVALREPIQKTTRSSALAYFDRGAQVEIVQRGTTTRVNVYSAEEGGSVLEQPLVTDLRGIPVEPESETAGWVAPGSYDILVGSPPAEGEEDARERFAEEMVSGTIGADLESLLADADAVVFKGVKDCSANPNYPAASAGDLYKVSVAGKIGGGSGLSVEAGDSLVCLLDGSAAGTQAAVGANWTVLQANFDVGAAGEAGKVLKADDPVLLRNVKSYGAKGDGVTDDAAAINAAIIAIGGEGGGILYFPPGTYLVKSNVALKSKVIVRGAGVGATTIKAATGVTTAPLRALAADAVEDLAIQDLTVDGNYTVFAGNVYGIHLSEAVRPLVTNVRVKDTYHIGIFASKCTEPRIDGCKGDNLGKVSTGCNAFHVSESVRARVFNNVVTDWGHNKEGVGIYCSASHGAQVIGNNVANPGGVDHLHMIQVNASNRCIVSNNQLDHTGFVGESLTTMGVSVLNSNDVAVEDNTIYMPSQDNGSREPIQVDGTSARATVSGNHCVSGDDNGITLWGGGEHTCNGNIVTGPAHHGISVNSNNCVVTGNVCKNAGPHPAIANPSGIAILTGVTGTVVVGNRCYDDQAVKTQAYGVQEVAGASANTIVGNDLTGNLTAPMLLTSTTTVVGPNQGVTPRRGDVEIRDIGAEAFGDGRAPVTPIMGTMQFRSDAGQAAVRTESGVWTPLAKDRNATLTDGATVTPSFLKGNHFILSAGGSRTIENVQFRQAGSTVTFDIKNNTAGAIVTTWNAGYKMAPWVDPAPGKRRTITFYYDGSNFIECGRVGADL